MTQDLKALMDRATDRPQQFVPDLDHLLVGGRRRARTHLVVSTVATAAVVGAAATAGALALNQGGGAAPSVLPAPPPAGQASRTVQPQLVTRCLDYVGQPSPKGAENWQGMVSAKDKYGSSTVRRSHGQLAFCSEFAAGTKSATRQVLLPRASAWLIAICNTKTDPTCTEILTVFMGQLPAKAVRVTVTPPKGQPVKATVRDGFFAYRRPGTFEAGRPTIARFYNAAGHEVAEQRL